MDTTGCYPVEETTTTGDPDVVWVADTDAERTGCTCPDCGAWRYCPATRGL